MKDASVIDRLAASDPGWEEWTQLISLVNSLDLVFVETDYMGSFYSAGERLSFAQPEQPDSWPDWIPQYVSALYGMKADHWENAGGYAESFDGSHALPGHVFSPAGNDEELGFPMIDVPSNTFAFQSNSNGAMFFVNSSLDVIYPDLNGECFKLADSLEQFTRRNIQQTINGEQWFRIYENRINGTLD